ncbi:glycosyltransferase family 4 protein [Amycolatopsis sp. K13G38]|uniref:Glycosyltransferase family 4 protein n=1 Tax=Amycolatopsis acididurans TaxID=2724524 RepID=A0ABX1JCP8_9PSEU|nr:glycosyltransferase [Amycolatopsis acididurans]NKQ56047.1 glycosyltransferase family 4 protein [Amycolatopsis acididurans]
MLRVAVIVTRLSGGAGALALRGVRALDPREYRATIVTGGGDRLLDDAVRAGADVVVEPSLRATIDPLWDLVALKRLTALLGDGRFDVAHTHCAKAGAVGRVAARRAGVPRIVHTYHGFPFHGFQSVLKRQSYVSIERRLGRITDLTLCVGASVAAEAIRRGLAAPGRVRTISVVVDPPPVRCARAEARRELGISADARVVGAVGRLTFQKAPEDFLAAMRMLDRPGTVGVWIGGGDQAAAVARLARALPEGTVVLTGDRPDVPDLLPALDVFALPSRYEGLPTALVEAMAAGIPAVATAVNAVPDVLVPGETGLLVPPGRPDLLAAAIRYLLDNPATAQRLARNACRHVTGRHTEADLRRALDSAYQSL